MIVRDEEDPEIYAWGVQKKRGLESEVTNRTQAREVLDGSAEWLKMLSEFLPDAYLLQDLKGTVIECNKAAEKLSGHNRGEIIGKNFFDLKLISQTESPKAAVMLMLNVLGLPSGPVEFIGSPKAGNQVFVEIRTFPIKIKDKTSVLCIVRDLTNQKRVEEKLSNKNIGLEWEITKRKQVEKALEMSELKYKEIVEFLPDLIYKTMMLDA
jgi:two-component system NtrC family sensor kinase